MLALFRIVVEAEKATLNGHVTLQAGSVHVLFHGTLGSIQTLVNVLMADGCTYRPPVVQHLGNMRNLVRCLGTAEHQVMILTAVKALPQAADFLHQFPANYRQVADVVAAAQIIRAVIRLIVGLVVPSTVFIHLVFIGENHIRLILQDSLCHLIQGICCQQIVVVTKGNPSSFCHADGQVGVAGDAFVNFSMHHMDAAVLGTDGIQRFFCGTFRAGTVI